MKEVIKLESGMDYERVRSRHNRFRQDHPTWRIKTQVVNFYTYTGLSDDVLKSLVATSTQIVDKAISQIAYDAAEPDHVNTVVEAIDAINRNIRAPLNKLIFIAELVVDGQVLERRHSQPVIELEKDFEAAETCAVGRLLDAIGYPGSESVQDEDRISQQLFGPPQTSAVPATKKTVQLNAPIFVVEESSQTEAQVNKTETAASVTLGDSTDESGKDAPPPLEEKVAAPKQLQQQVKLLYNRVKAEAEANGEAVPEMPVTKEECLAFLGANARGVRSHAAKESADG